MSRFSSRPTRMVLSVLGAVVLCASASAGAMAPTYPIGLTPGDPSVQEVLLTEVLSDPPGPDKAGSGEWVEVCNVSPSAVDLVGWFVGDTTDRSDRLVPWLPGGNTLVEPGGYAVILDPESEPALLGLPAGTVLLRPEDSSIGNGLRGDGDWIQLVSPSGGQVDTMKWVGSAGEGISWERAGSDPSPAIWRPSRASDGHTAGCPNSWTCLPGDRRVTWLQPPSGPLRAEAGHRLPLSVVDMGGTGLANIAVRISVSDGQMEDVLLQQSLPWIPPGDSTLIEWEWHPRTGGTWELVARITGPVRDRDWGDMDSLLVDVSFAIRTRILSEAMPRPQTGASEWLELWNSKTGPEHAGSSWAGWKIRVGSLATGSTTARTCRLPGLRSAVVIVSADGSPPIGFERMPPGEEATCIGWPGLQLADSGSRVVLIDPFGAVVDSSVLRPIGTVPRGHSLQRHQPDRDGWLPAAWRVSLTPGSSTPGWYERSDSTRTVIGPEPGRSPGGLHVSITHDAEGRIGLAWDAPVERLWLEGRVYNLTGRLVATPHPLALVPGRFRHQWNPRIEKPPLRAGVYLLVMDGRDADGEKRWIVRRALGVRP